MYVWGEIMYVKTLYSIDKENRDRGDHSHGVDNGAGGDFTAEVEEMLNDVDEEFVSVFITFPALWLCQLLFLDVLWQCTSFTTYSPFVVNCCGEKILIACFVIVVKFLHVCMVHRASALFFTLFNKINKMGEKRGKIKPCGSR